MQESAGLRIAVTGAGGFIGRAVVDRVVGGQLGPIAALRLNDLQALDHRQAELVLGSYADAAVRERLVADGIDLLFHLASLPGGATERNPALGRTVNLDGTLALLDAVAASGAGNATPVVVYASSIAALGRATQPVNDATALRPMGSYGTHKAMVEFYLADLTRRELIDARSVRPAGIVARPRNASAGFATAWMSELFHTALEQRGLLLPLPARAEARLWLQSVDTVADNIVHAALMPATGLPAHRAWTLPATVTRVDVLLEALRERCGPALIVEHGDSPVSQPLLDASAALALGFKSDGDVTALVDAVLGQIKRTAHCAGPAP